MKQIISILLLTITLTAGVQAQDFKTNLASAKTAYTSGNLEQAHFSLQQMLQEIDITIGKEILKLLPAKMDTMTTGSSDDEVTGNVGFIGASIRRMYGKGDRTVKVEIVNNSPLLGTLNSYLMSPVIAGLAGDGRTKIIKVQGYKARLERQDGQGEGSKPAYRIDIPFNTSLISVQLSAGTDTEITNMANSLPLAKIAKLIQ